MRIGKQLKWEEGGRDRYIVLCQQWGWDILTILNQESCLLNGFHDVRLHDNMIQVFDENLILVV